MHTLLLSELHLISSIIQIKMKITYKYKHKFEYVPRGTSKQE